MRELTDNRITVSYRLTQKAYRDLVADATRAIGRDHTITIPIAELTSEARLAILDLPTRAENGLNTGFSLRWPADVDAQPTADDLSRHLLDLLRQHNEQQQAIAVWISANEARLTDGRWDGSLSTYAHAFVRLGCDDSGDLRISGAEIPMEIRARARTAWELQRDKADAAKDEKFRAYLAHLAEHPLTATRDGEWILGPLPGAPETSAGRPHGSGIYVPTALRDRLNQIRDRAEALLAEKHREQQHQIATWLNDHGTESQKARFAEGFLPDEELWNAIRDWAFLPLQDLPRYERLKIQDVHHTDDCDMYDRESCSADYDVNDATALTADEYERLKTVRQLARACPIDTEVVARLHTATPACARESATYVVRRLGVLVSGSFAGRPLSREYAL